MRYKIKKNQLFGKRLPKEIRKSVYTNSVSL